MIEYYRNGNIKYEGYYIDGYRHRVDGPAVIWYDEDGKVLSKEYWVEGERYKTNIRQTL